MRTISEVAKDVYQNTSNPPKLSKLYMELGAMYGYYAEQIKPIKVNKSEAWVRIKKSGVDGKLLSDRYTDKLWSTTPQGKQEMDLIWKMKGLDKLMDAIKQATYINQQEGRNQA